MDYRNLQFKKIKQFIDFIEKLTEDDWVKINSGQAAIIFRFVEEPNIKIRRRPISSKQFSIDETNVIVETLRGIDSRQEGEEYLLKKLDTRNGLEHVAKFLDLHFSKRDNNQLLKNKIIESTIGYKLRSKAIQSNNSKSETDN